MKECMTVPSGMFAQLAHMECYPINACTFSHFLVGWLISDQRNYSLNHGLV